MILFCSCGKKETRMPYQDSRWIKGGLCSDCRRKRIVTSVTTKRVIVTRKEAQSFMSKFKFR